jgi:hypothetical protein
MERLPFSPRTLGPLMIATTLALAACNSLTGVTDLRLDNSDPEAGGGGQQGAPTHEGAGASSPTNGDGAAAPGGGGSGGETGTPTSTPTPTTTETATTTSTTTTTTTQSPVDCQYPNSGFGVDAGSYVSGNLAWQGYKEGSSQLGSVSIQDYFDCDGSKGINALLIDSSAVWCGACQEEAQDLPSQQATFQAKGIHVITLMIEDNSGNPATTSTATSWRNNFGLDAFSVCADPNFSFGGNGSVGLPLQIIVDPRTMKIVAREEGFGDYSTVLQLAQKNGG